MKNITSLKYLFGILIIAIFLASCSTVPKKEIDDAELAIKESEKINANKYAPEQLENAKTDLDSAKKLVVEEKNDEAKEKAITAKDKGWNAYFLSLAEFTKSEKTSTQQSMDTALESHADKVVPEKFNEGKMLYDEVLKELVNLKKLESKLKTKNSK